MEIKKNKKAMRDVLLTVLFVLGFGLAAEFLMNIPALLANGWKAETRREIVWEDISQEGFQKEGNRFTLTGDSGYIHIPLDGSYIGKFGYSYEYDGLLNVTVRVGMRNVYGESRERDAKTMVDRNSRVLQESWIPVFGQADYVDLHVTRDLLREPGLSYIDFDSMELAFTGFSTVTRAAVNWYRLFFFWCLGAVFAVLVAFRSVFAGKIEVGFLFLALTVGTLFSVALPANKTGWDEEVHFSQAFWISNYRDPVDASPALCQEFTAGIDTWPYNQPGSGEEQEALNAYLDRESVYENGNMLWSTDLNKATATGYVGQALFLKAGQLFHLPFSLLFRLGRLGNLLVYSLVIYFAIRKTPVGKAIMAFLALAPEPMMLAGVYSYDPTVTAFLWFSFACILRAILTEETVTWKEYVLMVGAFVWGCTIKAVYAPLILVGLLIPKERFRNEREYLLMKGGFVVVCGLMMLSFILPVLIAPRDIGDTRGQNTSEKGQMAYILGQPLAYARVLASNMLRTLPSYVIGENSLGLLGHQGQVSFPWLIYAGASAVILTGGQSSSGKHLEWKQKLWILVLCIGTAVLVWTSMYIAFTTPGNTYIDGVQGRYYIPFLFLLWLVLNPSRITVRLKNQDYYGLVLALSGGMLLACCYLEVIQKFCL